MKRCKRCDKWLTDYEARSHKCEEYEDNDIVDDIVSIGLGIAISSMLDDSSSSSSSDSSSSDFGGGGESLGGGSSDDW